jgi:tRNA-2-methylthio-N6-dimethylallyladenosine synthase
VVPYTRGTEVSRPLDDVLTEVALLAEQGVREINLLGQNVNSYLGKTGSETCDLAQLLRYLSEIPGIDRLRYTTSHPTHFNEALIEAFAELPKLASYLHLPVQAGSDRILAMMKRGYGRDAFLEKIRRVRQARPGLSISTDIIVGFPSETDEDFALTMDLVREADFDQAYSFIYSPRPGTPAANLKDNVPQAVKDERLQLLQQHIRGRDQAFMRGLYDTVQEVLVERPSRKNPEHMAGRTSSNRWVNFAAPASLIGQFVQVHINDVQPNSLRGVRV